MPTCRSSAHRQPAGLSGCDVDAVGQWCNDQPCTIAKVLIPACRHTISNTGSGLSMFEYSYSLCVQLMLSVDSLIAKCQLEVLQTYFIAGTRNE